MHAFHTYRHKRKHTLFFLLAQLFLSHGMHMSVFQHQYAAHCPVAEHALDGLALRDGDSEGVLLAVDPRREVEVDGLRGGAGAPAGTREVGRREAVPEVARDGVEVAVAAAVLPPGGVGEGGLAVDEDGVLLGHELVALAPAAVAGGDVAELGRFRLWI